MTRPTEVIDRCLDRARRWATEEHDLRVKLKSLEYTEAKHRAAAENPESRDWAMDRLQDVFEKREKLEGYLQRASGARQSEEARAAELLKKQEAEKAGELELKYPKAVSAGFGLRR